MAFRFTRCCLLLLPIILCHELYLLRDRHGGSRNRGFLLVQKLENCFDRVHRRQRLSVIMVTATLVYPGARSTDVVGQEYPRGHHNPFFDNLKFWSQITANRRDTWMIDFCDLFFSPLPKPSFRNQTTFRSRPRTRFFWKSHFRSEMSFAPPYKKRVQPEHEHETNNVPYIARHSGTPPRLPGSQKIIVPHVHLHD